MSSTFCSAWATTPTPIEEEAAIRQQLARYEQALNSSMDVQDLPTSL